MRLNYTYHPLRFLLTKAENMIPGIESVDIVYRNENRELTALRAGDEINLTTEKVASLQKKRVEIQQPTWFQKDEVYQFKQPNRQLKLEDENLLTSLVLPFESLTDHYSDLLIIHFHHSIGIKNFDKAFKNLTTDEKALISSMLFHSLQRDLDIHHSEKNAFNQIKVHYAKVIEENEGLKSKLKNTKELYRRAIVRLTYSITQQLERTHHCKIKIENEAIHKILLHQLDYNQLKTVIHNAFYIALNLTMSSDYISIHDSHLEINKKDTTNETRSNLYKGDKVIALLDRYELAAEKAFESGLPVNGKNVAAHLSPAVSPPAITDALKKNNKKISDLMEQFPSKWKLIRKNLKPLQIHQEKIDFRYKSTG